MGDLAAYLAGTLEQDPAAMVSGGLFAVAIRLAAADLINEARRRAQGDHGGPDLDDDVPRD